MASNPLNVYAGPDSVADYYDPEIQPPLPLVELPAPLNPYRKDGVRIYAKMMSMHPANNVKALPAMNMLKSSVVPDRTKTIIEYSSGSTVISMAVMAQVFHGVDDVRAFLSNKTSEAKVKLMQFFGLDLTLFGGPSQPEPEDPRGGIQSAQQQAAEDVHTTNPNQYENESNWQAHFKWTGPQILKQMPDIGLICAGMGTSGTMSGIGTSFKQCKPSVFRLGVCTKPGDRVPGPRSYALLQPVTGFPWRDAIDTIEEVGSIDSYTLSMHLSRQGLICGPSSGFNLQGLYQHLDKRKAAGTLRQLAAEDGSVHCVFICCDLPYQYINEYFAKLGEECFPTIHNKDLTNVDLYRYDSSWEQEADKILTNIYECQAQTPRRLSVGSDCDSGFGSESEVDVLPSLRPKNLILDFRRPSDFRENHLVDAINVPLKSLSSESPNPFTDSKTLAVQWQELEALFGDGAVTPNDKSAGFEWRHILARKDQDITVTLICYDGDTARIGTSVIRNQGIAASNIRGGMNAVLATYPDLDISSVVAPVKETVEFAMLRAEPLAS